jgi:Pyridoxal-dependent decarboxylase, pyridoxal binding domain
MSNSTDGSGPWDIQAARNLYNIHRWGAEYFDINEAGHVVAKPLRDAGASVDLTDVIEEARARGLKFPVLIRFQDILRHRVECLNLAFRNSIAEFNYQGRYRGVFPIKVNQLREVVEEILDAGKPFDFGLEVGSKPELFAGLAMQSQVGSLIVCNGYKDASFIRMALLGTKLNKKVIMVVEKLEELRQIIAISKQFGLEPLIGVRARLLSRGAGKWAESGGENAKFGLSTAELLVAAETWGIASSCCTSTSARRCRIFSLSRRRSRKPRGFTQSFTRWGSRSSTWMWGAAWEWITTAAGPPLTAPPTTPSRNTPTTSSITSPMSATPRRFRTRTSSARAAGRSWPTTACSSSRSSAPLKKPGRRSSSNTATTSLRW